MVVSGGSVEALPCGSQRLWLCLKGGAWGLGQITAGALTEPGKGCAITSFGTVQMLYILMQSYRCAVFKIESLLWQVLTEIQMGRMCQEHYTDAAGDLRWGKKAALAVWGRLDLKGMNQRRQWKGVEVLVLCWW